MTEKTFENALINETSPYLLQHAHNPVEWYPWCDEALERARREDKPILLSIGYSACHWCHVMAHESFEDEETAAIMNEHFINIKIDREERPDLDKIYQIAQQLLTQRNGGWPLTMFLTPEDHIPFFGGTYFPPDSRFGLPGFKELLQRVYQFYHDERESIDKQNRSMQEALENISRTPPADDSATLDSEPLTIAVHQLEMNFDRKHGGFSDAPKFPHPTSIDRLLRHYMQTRNEKALSMATFTLERMALSGVYDQLGGGFYRYSVDAQWMIPHFEKMLYDNGPLLELVCRAWQITDNPLFRKTAMETADWVIRDMQSSEGGYYSTLDADSEGEEGRFYTWTREEVQSLLTEQEYRLFADHFGLSEGPNFEGKWHLRITMDLDEVAKEYSLDIQEAEQTLQSAREKLLATRNQRVWPGRDEKILTSWNALMIKGMAVAAQTFNKDSCTDSAASALTFIHDTLWQNNYLRATYKDGRARLNAYLDDYAITIDAILALLQVRWDRQWLDFAVQLAEALLDRFEDRENGGFFFTSHDHEKLIQRNKPLMDDALPAGNGVAASVLGRLGHILGEKRYLNASERTLRAAWNSIQRYPAAHNALLQALEEYLQPPMTVIIRGEGAALQKWCRTARETGNPFKTVLGIPAKTPDLPGLLAERSPKGDTVAYICQGHQCLAPVTQLDQLAETLNDQ